MPKVMRLLQEKKVNKDYGHKYYTLYKEICKLNEDNIRYVMAYPYKGPYNV